MCCTAVFRPSKDPYVYFSPDLLQRIGLSSGESKFHGLQAECFEDLINRDWTRRIWTYQEVLLSRNPIVICGKAQVHWSRVVLSMLWLNYLGNGVLPTGTQSWIQVAIARKGLMRKMSSSSYDHSSHGGPSMGASQPPLNSAVARSEEIDPMDNVSCSVYLAFLVRVHRFSVYFAILSFAAFAAVASILFAFSFLSPVPINGRRFHTSELALALCACLVLTGLMAIAVGVQRVKVWRPIYRKPSKQMRSANNIDGFLEAVITRKCSRPEDKAFGLQAVVSIKAGRQLPPPDMTTSLGNIYQQFTKSLYYATEDLRFLSMAAITEICGEVGIYGQPSWVPDWSLAPDVGVEWLDPFRVAPARPGGIFLGTHSEPMNMHQLLTTKSFCEFQDGSLPKIVIRGYHYCTVADTFKFESTSEKYDETEHDKHLRNIRSIHTLIQARSSSIIFIKSISATPFDILEISSYLSFISVSSVAPSSAVMHILCLSRKINRSSFRSLAVLLARFMCALPTFLLSMSYSNFLRLKKRHTLFSGALLMASMLDDLLGVHITICSRFAEENKNVFAGILPQDENAQQQKVVGLCSPDVEAGDVVIITSGPPQQPL